MILLYSRFFFNWYEKFCYEEFSLKYIRLRDNFTRSNFYTILFSFFTQLFVQLIKCNSIVFSFARIAQIAKLCRRKYTDLKEKKKKKEL